MGGGKGGGGGGGGTWDTRAGVVERVGGAATKASARASARWFRGLVGRECHCAPVLTRNSNKSSQHREDEGSDKDKGSDKGWCEE